MFIRHIIKTAFLLICFVSSCYLATAQKNTEKFLKFRNEDSVWSVGDGLWGPGRFFIGDTRVRFRGWRDHLTQADDEVGILMKKGTALRRTSTWIGLSGFAATLVGFRMASLNSRSWGVPNPSKQKTGNIIAGVGAIAMIVSLSMETKVWRLYTSGERLFNNKLRQGKLESLNLQLQASPTHAGLVLEW